MKAAEKVTKEKHLVLELSRNGCLLREEIRQQNKVIKSGSAHNGRLISPKIRHFHPRLPSYEDDDGVYHHVKNKGHNRRSNGHVKSSRPKSPKGRLLFFL
ncbi:hypothetical protein TNIN_366941 [Trichonephila inaurata madagascariensis]|uniref:Uncharacterized protein n=1 Tax=Trichonephila inaurata madagascariensis TaxID=2747483 RepID=A0A8X6K7M8_9ARAC|nr:hypothetical protein TNIN_366941 [Trichonephila inaurata madagascariensis]